MIDLPTCLTFRHFGGRRVAAVISAVAVSAVLAMTAATSSWGAEKRSYLLATANTGGTYYPVGEALATMVKLKLMPSSGISMSAINSAGSAENVKLLRDDETQFAILQGIYGVWAWRGTGELAPLGPQEYLRSVTVLWLNAEHFILAEGEVKTGTVQDLRTLSGRKFSIGNRNSGAQGSTREILRRLGINEGEAFEPIYLGYGPSADALQNRTIIGMSLPGGPPVSAVTRAFAMSGTRIRLLEFTDGDLESMTAEGPLWSRFVLPAGTYPGQDQPVHTIAEPNFLAVRADVDEEAVYLITKAIYDNLGFLAGIHPATREMAVEHALDGLIAPLHRGALRYYRDHGLHIPEALLPQ